MSNKVLITGNGFDLYHGLPTRYSDFLFLAKHWDEFYKGYQESSLHANDEVGNLEIRPYTLWMVLSYKRFLMELGNEKVG